ncbi:hypothetical protein [Salinibacter ruber]|uniref:Uncharacterized protein n=1 Tax=Salinibacter ruber TaxID=146919 RepID=A0A9X2U7A1_9BACT|nr:hypothetical protein [Salinibacter ruber]MCS3655357.1 hypothetical protein [Salinibacter ruber]MCS3951118.1 hypothetical protein [Salinibacter ruber]MCS4116516.1 hypothetical protein [Salinibacter ruber]MCS4153065.1 hypothetical protein [Salinibacter ruber]MCS4168878.1 hypothetical protein [Salinibacter ruber]
MRHPPGWHPQEALRSGALCAVCVVGWALLTVGGVGPAAAQTTGGDASLIERYQNERYRALARRHLRQKGTWPAHPPVQLPTPTDSLHLVRPSAPSPTAQLPSFPLDDVRPVRHLEREWFRSRFADAEWAFLGGTADYTFLDTTRTPALRARLQAKFGDPTQTLADAPIEDSLAGRPQFEYWFVVNDSIPVQVMDGRGPQGRGLIVAADRAYRHRLRGLRDTLLAPLQDAGPAPHVDYYYDERRRRWYRTGYDGRSFFLTPISRGAIVPGRRPRLDTTRTSDASASSPPSP